MFHMFHEISDVMKSGSYLMIEDCFNRHFIINVAVRLSRRQPCEGVNSTLEDGGTVMGFLMTIFFWRFNGERMLIWKFHGINEI